MGRVAGVLAMGWIVSSCTLLFPYAGPPAHETSCGDGQDEDEDGATDCRDSDCTCEERGALCDDGVDNDRDGYLDAYDARCWTEVTIDRCASVGGGTVDLLEPSDFTLNWSGGLEAVPDTTGHHTTRYEPPVDGSSARFQYAIGGAVSGTVIDVDLLYTPGARSSISVVLGGVGARRASAETLGIGVLQASGNQTWATVAIHTPSLQLVGRSYLVLPSSGDPLWVSFHVEITDTVAVTAAGRRIDLPVYPTSWAAGEPLEVRLESQRFPGEIVAVGDLRVQRGPEQPCGRPVPTDLAIERGELLGAARGPFVCGSVRDTSSATPYYGTARSDDGITFTDLGDVFLDLPPDAGELTELRQDMPIAWSPVTSEFVGAVALTRPRHTGEVVRPPLGDLVLARSGDCATFRTERAGLTLPTQPFGDGEIALIGDDAVRADPAEIVIDASGRTTVYFHVLSSNDLATLTSPDGTPGTWAPGARVTLLPADEGGYVRHEDHLLMLGDDTVLVDRSGRDGALTLWVADPEDTVNGPWRLLARLAPNEDPTRFDSTMASGILLPPTTTPTDGPFDLALLYSGTRPLALSNLAEAYGDATIHVTR